MSEIDDKSHIINTNAKTQEDLLATAKKFYEQGKYEQAIKIYSDLLIYSMDSDLYVKIGNCFEKMDKVTTATEYWKKAIDVDPMNSTAFINLGNYHYKKKEVEKAISYWMASLLSMPEEPTSNLNLAVAYTLKGYSTEAFIYYERYLKFAQDKTSSKYISVKTKMDKNKKLGNDYLKLGVQYQNCGDNKSALKCYVRALSYCPIYSKIHLNLGSIYYADKNYAESVKHWTNAFYLDPNYPKIINNLAISYDLLQEFDYAYCYYARYSKYLVGQPEELEKVTTRCHKIKPILNANPYLVSNHLDKANKAFSECRYIEALNEYRNYMILAPEEQHNYMDLTQKIEKYLAPDKCIIESCLQKGKQLMDQEKDIQNAKQYFARVMVLANKDTREYIEAKGRLSLCMQVS
ncbi:hypothetical protein IKE67_07360 [bacterium]|nr:hypothetical protein [bacterium]